jgi:hypothetical protein
MIEKPVLIMEVRHYDLNKPMYKIVFDNGKPYENNAYDDEDLKDKLKEFYLENKDSGDFYDCKVYNTEGEEITESQFIQEMIGEILE